MRVRCPRAYEQLQLALEERVESLRQTRLRARAQGAKGTSENDEPEDAA
jgi:hypothetical protein